MTKIKCSKSEREAVKRAENLIGNRADFELRNMKKALSMLSALNSPQDNQRLKAVKTILKLRKKCKLKW